MVERVLTLRFVGRDAGLAGIAGKSADSVTRLGGAASQADQQLQRLGRGGGFASFSQSIGQASDRTSDLQGRLGALTQANVNLAASLKIPVSSVQDLNKSLSTLPDKTAVIANEYLKLQRSGTEAADAQRILARTIGLNEQQFQSLEKTLGPTIKQLEEVKDLSGFEDLAVGAGALAGTLGILGGISFNNFSQFEQFEAALANAFQDSDRASDELARISEFAAETPFQVDALTQSFISLVNRGFIPTNQELTNLGDIAASQSKEFDQLAEALLDAETGEFERLKEFGILARSAGDEVTLSFRGIEQTVAKTPEAIREAIVSFGQLDGVAGSLEAQSQTTAGAVSNLQDSLQQASVAAGGVVAAGLNPLIDGASSLVNTFLALPAPLQAALVATTGFAGALAGAITLIATFEALQISSRVATAAQTAATIANTTAKNAALAIETAYAVAQTVSNIAITRGNVALAANAVATKTAAAAKQLYALATGQAATAATILGTRLAVVAAQAALVVGAIAAVSQVFKRSEGAQFANDLREAVAELENTRDAASEAGTEIREGFFDVLNDFGPIEATQALLADLEAAFGGASNSASRFGEQFGILRSSQLGAQRAQFALAEETDRLGGSVQATSDLLFQFGIIGNNIQLPADQVRAFTAASADQVKVLGEEIELLEAQKGQSGALDRQLQSEIDIRENLIATIQDKVRAQGGDVEAVGAAAEAAKELSDVLDELSQRYDDVAQSIDATASEDFARIAQQQAAGLISEQEAETQRFNVERQQLQDQIANSRAELEALRAQRNERADNPEEAAQLDREILKLRQEVADAETKLATDAIDRQEDLADAEQKAADDRKKAIEDAEKERLEAIEAAAAEALAVTTETAQQREIELAQLRRDGVITEQEYQDQLAAASSDRIMGELEAEKAKLAELEAADGDFADEIRESRQQVNNLTLDLIEEEIAAEERAKEAAIAAISERVSIQTAAVDEEVRQIGRLERAYEAANQSLERRQQLLSARAGLQDALGGLQQTAFDVLIDTTDDPEEQARLREQAAEAELEALDRAQALQLLEFDLKQQGLAIENQILQARLRGQLAENRSSQIEAQGELDAARASGDQQRIRQAESNLASTQAEGEALAQEFGNVLAQNENIQRLGNLGRNEIIAQQRDERLSLRSENLDTIRSDREREQERRSIRREARDAIGDSDRLGDRNFQQALANGLQQLAGQQRTPIALPNIANPPITSAIPAAQSGLTPQAVQQLIAQQGGGAITINQTNDVQITVTGEQATDGTLASNVEEQVFGALNNVITRASRQN